MAELIKQRYQLLEKLGQGGFGAVYKAFDQVLSREVAIKLLNLSNENQEEMVLRFQVESRVASRLEHQNILRVYDFGRDDNGRCYLVSELLIGDSLHAHLKAKKSLPLSLALDVLFQVGSALELAHEQNTVHRDIKPPNIFLKEPMRGASFVKLLDFGIAKVMGGDESLTVTGQIMGTPHYMSPEQIVNIKLVDHRSDIYSLGIVFYQMVMGAVPFDDESYFTIMKQQMQSPMPSLKLSSTYPPELERELNGIVKAMTRKDVRKRVNHIGEILYKVQQLWASYPELLSPMTTGSFRSITGDHIKKITPSLDSIDQMLQPFEGADELVDQLLNEVKETDSLSELPEERDPPSDLRDSLQPEVAQTVSNPLAQGEQVDQLDTPEPSTIDEVNSTPQSPSESAPSSRMNANETPVPPTLSANSAGSSAAATSIPDIEVNVPPAISPLSSQELDTVYEPQSSSFKLQLNRKVTQHLIQWGVIATIIILGLWWGSKRPFDQEANHRVADLNAKPRGPHSSPNPMASKLSLISPVSQVTREGVIATSPSERAQDAGVAPLNGGVIHDDLGVSPAQRETDQTDPADLGAQVDAETTAPSTDLGTSPEEEPDSSPSRQLKPTNHKPRPEVSSKTTPLSRSRRLKSKRAKGQRSKTKITRSKRRSKRRSRPKLTGEIKFVREALSYEVGQSVKLRLPPSAKSTRGVFLLGCATWKNKARLEIKFKRASRKCIIKYCVNKECIRSRSLDVSEPLFK